MWLARSPSTRRGGARAGCGARKRELRTTTPRLYQRKSSRGARGECIRYFFFCLYLLQPPTINVCRITSIAAGNDHLLALTSCGRTFVHPITKNANTHGQLGFRKFDIPDPSSATAVSRLDVELTPRAIADPYAKSSRYARDPSPSAAAAPVDVDTNLKFSDRFFEVPALRDVRVVQIAAGARSSFVRTDTGRVLGWGANDYGCVYSSPYLQVASSLSSSSSPSHYDDRTDKLVSAGLSRLTRSPFPRKLYCGGALRVAHVRNAST